LPTLHKRRNFHIMYLIQNLLTSFDGFSTVISSSTFFFNSSSGRLKAGVVVLLVMYISKGEGTKFMERQLQKNTHLNRFLLDRTLPAVILSRLGNRFIDSRRGCGGFRRFGNVHGKLNSRSDYQFMRAKIRYGFCCLLDHTLSSHIDFFL